MLFLTLSAITSIVTTAFDGSFGGSQVIQDNGDSFLTVTVKVGDKVIKVIPDSGSFDLYLIDQGACSEGLGLCRMAYNSKESGTHKFPDGDVIKDVVFGSGTARCRLGFDKAELVNEDDEVNATAHSKGSPMEAPYDASFVGRGSPKVLFPLWQIFALDEGLLRIWGDGKGFQGILGMGYKAGEDVSPDEALKQLNATEGVSAVTGVSTLAPGEGASELFTDKFAICLPRGSRAKKLVLPELVASRGLRSTSKAVSLSTDHPTKFEDLTTDDKGMLWWGASIPRSRKFPINTPVIGVRHWTIGIKSVQVVDSTKGGGGKVLTSFCDQSPCAALVDSGTSLFALPVPRVKEIFRSLGDLKLDCSNVQDLPDIQIALGDSKEPLVITPESYVMKIQAHDLSLYESFGQSLMLAGDLQRIKSSANPNVTLCLPAFMASPVSQGTVKDFPSYLQTEDHLTEMMILGIPIFREYTVLFDRQSSAIAFDRNPDDGSGCSSSTTAGQSSLIHQGHVRSRSRRPLAIRSMPAPENLIFPSGLDSLRRVAPPSSGAVIGSERML
ncbi:conserved hypothetical protein [Perkinsus marinus ATCC 50983]|uniref:Peptidase A1 domain-containing protein n=1 Tax=Perkinsus marinus (strain ATCC 50983 / TXsc) TaxID=423536 RepID=C5LAT5_PERM5|nr:conserved hypothetical protein [Perkinsus marinus ATCC 50983]EER06162.1 conserved hypothetical protein [Perkinsus marinus ATCC 50983]|eukprot:XP_002774346.1 conserved hypothetical protein [Perkinsus marinus ATCC 50983]